MGLIIIGLIISVFFILVIVMLCKTYSKDIFELEDRVLQLEKRINECEKFKKSWEALIDNASELNGIFIDGNCFMRKEGDDEMACKKGRGGRKK